MPIAVKYALAGLLLAGVSVVWMPRATGVDPLAWFSRQAPEPDDSSHSIDAPVDDPLPVEEGPAVARIENLPVKELEQIVHFLERRDFAQAPRAAATRPIAVVVEEHPGDGETGPSDAPPEVLRELEAFLAQHPLNAILIGKGQGTALFGTRRVVEGDRLLDGAVEVGAIEAGGVVLGTAHGNVRVSLPPPGGRSLEAKQP